MSTAPSSLQYMRVAQIVVGKAGQGLLIENLRMEFKITKTLTSEPNVAIVKIYNLSPDHETQVRNEFDDVIVNAGYRDAVRLIFRGTIKHAFHYRKANDYITELEVGDGDKDLRNAYMNLTLSAGTSDADLITAAVATFSSVGRGFIGIEDRKRFKGRTISGPTKDVLTTLAAAHNASWSVQDGNLTIVKANGVLPDQAILVTSETGLLGAPEASDKGISVKTLMNPQMRVNGVVKLDNNNIKLKTHHKAMKKAAAGSILKIRKPTGPVRLDPDGLYKIIRVDHEGDTRGKKWTTDLICIGLSQPIPQASIGVYGGE